MSNQSKQSPQVKVKRRRRRRPCSFCADKITAEMDYKAINRLQRFISERGKIQPRRNTWLCAKHQRTLAQAIKKSRYIGLLPFCVD